MVGHYNSQFVVWSLIIAFLGCYGCIRLLPSVPDGSKTRSLFWTSCSALAFAIGAWNMHFIGMISYKLPIPIGYDLAQTALSFFYVFAGALSALLITHQKKMKAPRFFLASVLLGFSVIVMHYTGMSAMLIVPMITYSPATTFVAMVIACAGAAMTLRMSHYFRRNVDRRESLKIKAALVMSGAIAGMHYTAMAGALLQDGSFCGASVVGLNDVWMVVFVVSLSALVIVLLLVAFFLESKFYSMQQQLKTIACENEGLFSKAFSDHLTGLCNRLGLEDALVEMIKHAHSNKRIFAALFIDLDGFKKVNDTYGHEVGDALLCLGAERLRAAVRRDDVVARLGGDEFVILAWVNTERDAFSIKLGVAEALSAPFHYAEYCLRITGSVGVAFYPKDGGTASELLVSADRAMYTAKAYEKNMYI